MIATNNQGERCSVLQAIAHRPENLGHRKKCADSAVNAAAANATTANATAIDAAINATCESSTKTL